LIAFSIATMIFLIQIGRRLNGRFGVWSASLLAAAGFIVMMSVIAHLLPDEVPAVFPVNLMWRFRIAGLEMHALLWPTLGLLFRWLTERDWIWLQL
jgi:predicted cobalt transporter CbtA